MGIIEAPASDRPNCTAMSTLCLKVPGSREFVHLGEARGPGVHTSPKMVSKYFKGLRPARNIGALYFGRRSPERGSGKPTRNAARSLFRLQTLQRLIEIGRLVVPCDRHIPTYQQLLLKQRRALRGAKLAP
jgi:hypothetical protein